MRRLLGALLLLAAAELPSGAKEVTAMEADLNGDGLADRIVGYTLPRQGLPPTEGYAMVLEQNPGGRHRRFDLPGGWGGHYRPEFVVQDLTGDGRPELVIRVAGGAGWHMLFVFRRTPEEYKLELWDGALLHHLWDADGDGLPEVIGMQRQGAMWNQAARRFIWKDGRFVAWHELPWVFDRPPASEPVRPVPDVKGMTAAQAEIALLDAGLTLGAAVLVDAPGPGGKVLRQSVRPETLAELGKPVLVSIGAGDTRFQASALPRFEVVHYHSDQGPGSAPVATAQRDLRRWHAWLQGKVQWAEQVVQARLPEGPTYSVRLEKPWIVTMGGKRVQVRWLTVGTKPPHQGLIYLGTGEPRPGYIWSENVGALYTKAELEPLPIPPVGPVHWVDIDAFVTRWPENWTEAVRHRGLPAKGWPEVTDQPELKGPPRPAAAQRPDPDHAVVTVLGGQVDRAEQIGDRIDVWLAAEPGKVHRWRLPLTGYTMATRHITINLRYPDGRVQSTTLALDSWTGPEN